MTLLGWQILAFVAALPLAVLFGWLHDRRRDGQAEWDDYQEHQRNLANKHSWAARMGDKLEHDINKRART